MIKRWFGKIRKKLINAFKKAAIFHFYIRLKLVRPHLFLRKNLKWYHEWHNHRYHKHVHVSVLALYILFTLLSMAGLPRQMLAANGSWDFGAGVNGSGDANISTAGGTVKLAQDWWDTAYGKRQLATVNTTDAAASGYSAKADVDLESLRAVGSVNNDLSDLRTVAKNRTDGTFTELDRDIVKGQGASLNGSTDYIRFSGAYFNYDVATLEFWFYANSWADGTTLVSKNGGNSSNGYIQYTSSQLRYYSPGNSLTVNWGSPSIGAWHHLALVVTGSQHLAYLDGSLVGSAVSSTNDLFTGNYDFQIGQFDTGSYRFNGRIDEVRISNTNRYSSNFTPQQTPFTPDTNTKGLWHLDNDAGDSSGQGNNGTLNGSPYYTEGKVIAKGANAMGRELTSTDTGLVGNWKMNNNWLDSQTNVTANNGTRYGTGTAFNTTTQKLGAAAGQFNGTDDYVSVPDSSAWTFGTASFSMDFWVKLNEASPASRKPIISTGTAVNDNNTFAFYQSTGGEWQISLATTNKTWTHSSASDTTNWHHIAIVRPSGINDFYVYVDGAQLSGTVASGSWLVSNSNFDWPGVQIGKSWDTGKFNGLIDETAIYNRALSASEIQEHYNAKNEVWFKTQSAISASSTSEASGNHSYYLYYDNNSATNPPEDTGNVYLFHDDFNRADSTDMGAKWTEYGDGNWQISSQQAYRPDVASGMDDFALANVGGSLYPITDAIIESRIRVTALSGSDNHLGITGRANATTTGHRGYSLLARTSVSTLQLLDENVAWGQSASTSQALNQYYNYKLRINGTNIQGKSWDPGLGEPGSWLVTNTFPTNSSGYAGMDAYNTGTGTAYFDDFKIRAFAANEPTTTFASEELLSSAVYLSPGVWTSNGITATGIYGNWVQMTFTDAEPGTTDIKYKVYQSGGSTLIPDGVLPGNSTGFDTSPISLSGIATSTYGTIIVKATLTGGTQTPTVSGMTVSYTYDITPPTVPTALTVGSPTNSSVPLSWTGSTDSESGLSGYVVQRALDSGGSPGTFSDISSGTCSGTIAISQCTDNSVSVNTKYWYRVRAKDNVNLTSNWNDYTTTNIYSSAGDGNVYNQGADFSTVRNASSGVSADYTNTPYFFPYASNWSGEGPHRIGRGFLAFDTSAIGAGSIIDNTSLFLYITAKAQSGTAQSFSLVQGSQASTTSLITDDYDQVGSVEFINRVAISSATTNAYNSFVLNANGLSNINKTGFTKLAARFSHDIDNVALPSSSYTEWDISFSEQAGTSQDPYLAVNYSQPVSTTTLSATPTLNSPTTPTNDNTPSITGSTTPNVTVKLYDGVVQKASRTADGSGNFTFDNASYGANTLSEGNHTNITARSLNADSVESPNSNAATIFIDTGTPATSYSTFPASPDGANGYFNTNPAITLTVSDPAPSAGNGTTTYKWDDAGFSSPSAYTGPVNMFDTVGSGVHILYWRTTDSAGNQEAIQSQQFKLSNIVPAPTSVAVDYSQSQSQTVNQFRFGWDHPVGITATAYYYKINTPPTQGSATAISTFNSCSISGTTYDVCTPFFAAAMVNGLNTFYVVTQDDAMNVGWSQPASQNFSINVVQSNVKVPVNISLSDSSNRASSKWAITASWDAPSPQDSNFASYVIERSENGSAWASAGETTATAYADTGLDTAKSYYYRVKIKTSFGELSDPVTTANPLQPTGKFTTPPVIVAGPTASNITATSAVISWSTNRSSSSFVEYGTTTNYGLSNGRQDSVTSHSVTVSGLSPATRYNFRAQSLDEDRDYPTTVGYSSNFTFTTSNAPAISEVRVTDIGLVSAIITWKTNTVSTSRVSYGKSTSYGQTAEDASGSQVTTHTIKIENLDHTSVYNFKITGTDTDGNVLSSDNYVFSTLTFPRVSNVKYSQVKEASSATYEFTWDSNVKTSSIIEYKEANSTEKKEVLASAYVDSHKLKVANLKDNANYIIIVKGRDEYGNESTSETTNLKTDYDTRSPLISDITVETSILGAGKDSKGQLVISWLTDEPSTSQIEYGVGVSGDSYSSKTQEDTTLTTSHVVIISDLTPSTSYHFRVISKDAAGNKAESKDNSALTEQAADSVVEIILNSLEKTVGWIFRVIRWGR